tara:strand:- start:34 stop:720 length:687 start_codon:yes stop_codon:yes gene_type:complete
MKNQYTRQDDMFTIFTGQTDIGCISKHGNKYRLIIGKKNRRIYSYDEKWKAEDSKYFENKLLHENQMNKTIKQIQSSDLSKTLKKKYIACTKRVYKNDLRKKIGKEIVMHLSEKFGDARKNSSQKGRTLRKFNITFDYVLEMYYKTNGICPLFNKPFVLNDIVKEKYLRNYKAPSIDRWDNSKGYVYGNIKIISWNANRMKGNLSLKGLEAFCQNTLNYLNGNGKKTQ